MLTDERQKDAAITPAPRLDHEAERDGDAASGDGGPLRRCIATGVVRPKTDLIRFVLSPDGVVTPDIAEKLPGRGLWLAADAGALKTAMRKGAFSRAARQKATVPDNLENLVAELLTRRCIEYLSLARRAGEAVTGFEKCAAQLRADDRSVYTAALDRGEDGAGKLERAAGAGVSVHVLTRAELGQAFGRSHAVHVVIKDGGLARAFLGVAGKLAGIRSVGTSAEAAGAEGNEHE